MELKFEKQDAPKKVLFIASNIPTPKRKSNKVVMTIAHKLSTQFDISVLHPAEWAPFPINLMKKYRNIAGSQSWEDEGIAVRPFKYIRLIGTNIAFRLLPYYKRRIQDYCQRFGTPQLVHAHYALPDGYLAYLLFNAYQVPYLISFRKSDIKFLQAKKSSPTYKTLQTVLKQASQIIVHNVAQQELLSNEGFDSIVVPHGIEKDFIVKKESENNTGTINIATVGELIPLKQINWVIEAVKNYKGNKDLTLTIAGDGPMRQEMEISAQGYNNIVFLGNIAHEKVGDLLCHSDIFALPSNNETFGVVYIEAAGHQNAVIATKGTGVWGIFNDKEEMLYCDSFDSFRKILYELIDNDLLRNTIAKNAYDKTSKLFTWDKVIEKYVELYHDCIAVI